LRLLDELRQALPHLARRRLLRELPHGALEREPNGRTRRKDGQPPPSLDGGSVLVDEQELVDADRLLALPLVVASVALRRMVLAFRGDHPHLRLELPNVERIDQRVRVVVAEPVKRIPGQDHRLPSLRRDGGRLELPQAQVVVAQPLLELSHERRGCALRVRHLNGAGELRRLVDSFLLPRERRREDELEHRLRHGYSLFTRASVTCRSVSPNRPVRDFCWIRYS